MRRAVVLALFGAVLATTAGPAPDAQARDRCRVPADATDVTRGAEVIAFRANLNELGHGLWACRRDERRRWLIEGDDPLYRGVDTFRVAGRYVGWVVSEPPGCKADCPPNYTAPLEVLVEEVGTDRNRGSGADHRVGALALTPGGVLVWTGIDGAGRGVVRRMSPATSRGTLDIGSVDLSSLRVRGRTATWTAGGVPRSAALPAR